MTDDSSLQRKYIRSEAERIRLKHLNSALRNELEKNSVSTLMDLTPLSRGFMASYDRPHSAMMHNTDSLWREFSASNAGLNRRYRIYIGYLYERMGWDVDYSSGKNLVSHKDDKIIVTASETITTIDISTMYALIGSAMEHKKDNMSFKVSAICITSSALISRVMSLAQKFSVAVREQFYFRNFPCIRCKADVDGQRVYYVPDDEEYLSVEVIPSIGDRYCWSIEEAESLHFYPVYRPK